MMKKILAGVVVVLCGLLGYTFLSTGKIGLFPASPASAEGRQMDQQIDRLDARFVSATHRLNQAGWAAGATGVDSTSEAQAALDELFQVERELLDLKTQARTDETRSRIDQILAKVRKVKTS